MKSKLFISVSRVVLLLILLCLSLTGCGCKHEWNPATCATPKTCSLCQVTEGEALGHTYADATCETPKTCTVCKATEGEALGHTWVEATCQAPKTCTVCKQTDGDALPHTLSEATVTKEANCTEKGVLTTVCTVCNEVQSAEEIPTNNNHDLRSTVTKAPSCTQAGNNTLTCTICKYQTTKSISATGHKFTGGTCVNAGTCSVCGATGSTGGHSFVVTYEFKSTTDTFASKRIQKCSHCGVEKTEYSSRGNTYDLDAIKAELVTYAKSLGFSIADELKLSPYQKPTISVTYTLWDVRLFTKGAPYLLENMKLGIKKIYDEKIAQGYPLGSLYIDLSYSQSGAIGGGAFCSTLHYSQKTT